MWVYDGATVTFQEVVRAQHFEVSDLKSVATISERIMLEHCPVLEETDFSLNHRAHEEAREHQAHSHPHKTNAAPHSHCGPQEVRAHGKS